MKSAAGFAVAALVAGAHAAGWEDKPVDPVKTTTTTPAVTSTWVDYDPAKTTTTTTSKPADPQTYWGDAPVDPTTKKTTSTSTSTTKWEDYTVSTTSSKPVKPTTTSSKPVKDTTTTKASTWVDVPAPADPTATWVDSAVGACKVVTVTKTGTWIWVPAPADPTHWVDVPAGSTKTTTSSKPVKPTTTTVASSTWIDYPVDPTSTSTSTTSATWGDVTTIKPTTTASAKPTTLSTKTTSTSSAAPKPTGAVCPNDNGKTLASDGSCQGKFQVNCDVKASPGPNTKFWQRKENEKISTLAACIAICNDNSACEAVLYVNGKPESADNELCWQTSGLGPVTGTNYAQIAYKTGATGACKGNYNSTPK